MRHGHAPLTVRWHWPIWDLLGFLHADLRRQGLRTYKPRPPVPLTTTPVTFTDPWDGIS